MAERIGWGNFPDLFDYDRFAVRFTTGTPNQVQIWCGTAAAVTWWKAYKILDRRTGRILVEQTFENADHGPRLLVINAAEVESVKFVLAKAKIFGFHTDMYEIYELRDVLGQRIDLNWLTDGPNNVFDAIGSFFRDIFTPIVRAVVTLVSLIVQVFFRVVSLILNWFALAFNFLAAIPGVGRAVSEALHAINYAIHFVANSALELVTQLGSYIGIRAQNKFLKLAVIIQRDETGAFVASRAQVERQIEFVQRLFQIRGNVIVVPHNPIGRPLLLPYETKPTSPSEFIIEEDVRSDATTLDLRCNAAGFFDALGVSGSAFQSKIARLFWGGAKRETGFGGPLVAFAVRSYLPSVPGGPPPVGCSAAGPLVDYVTVDFVGTAFVSTLAHEIGHACGLLHTGRAPAPFNLMQPLRIEPSPLADLTPWLEDAQMFVIRASNRTSLV